MTDGDTAVEQRRAARVILLSPDDKVLLIEFSVQRSTGEFVFWATPGGEIEASESDHAAAERELREELNLALPLEGPVHSASSVFEHKGKMLHNSDVFFLARCASDAPRLTAFTEEERDALRRWRWWSPAEIADAHENIFPKDLASVVKRLAR